jgi:hypothetical protein
MELTFRQTEALDILENYDNGISDLLYGGGAGGGKSMLGCYWQMKRRLMYPNTRSVIGRASLKTLRETTLNTFFKVARMQGVEHTFKYVAPSTIRFNNGSEILLKDLFYYPSDPECDELGSLEIMDAFIDEANQVVLKVKNVLKSRIREFPNASITPKIGMTCNPAKNWTKLDYYSPWVKKQLLSHRMFVRSTLDDNQFISPHYRTSLEQLDVASKARLLDGNWDFISDPNQLISAEAIMNLFTNSFVKGDGKRYITADIARFGSARTIIRVWDGWVVLKRVVLIKKPITETAYEIKMLSEQYQITMSKVICDEDGIGGGVVDILRCKGFVANRAASAGNYASMKDQCGFHVAKIINEGKAYENTDDESRDFLSQELEQLKEKTFDVDGKRKLVSKDEIVKVIGRSPDDSDTYLMRAWFDVNTVMGPSIITHREVKTNGRTI